MQMTSMLFVWPFTSGEIGHSNINGLLARIVSDRGMAYSTQGTWLECPCQYCNHKRGTVPSSFRSGNSLQNSGAAFAIYANVLFLQ